MSIATKNKRIRSQTVHRVALVAAVLLAFLAGYAHGAVLTPTTATYKGSYGILNVGTATLKLTRDDDCWRWHSVVQPTGLAALLLGKVTDNSRFCVVEGSLQPRYFAHHEAGDAEDSYTLSFDWDNGGSVRHNGGEPFAVPAGAVDPFLLQLAARRWLAQAEAAGKNPASLPPKEFAIVDENEIKHYRLAVSEGRRITTPAGTFETLRVARIDDSDEQIVFWAAPKLDYLPVRVEHVEDGSTTLSLELIKLEREENRGAV